MGEEGGCFARAASAPDALRSAQAGPRKDGEGPGRRRLSWCVRSLTVRRRVRARTRPGTGPGACSWARLEMAQARGQIARRLGARSRSRLGVRTSYVRARKPLPPPPSLMGRWDKDTPQPPPNPSSQVPIKYPSTCCLSPSAARRRPPAVRLSPRASARSALGLITLAAVVRLHPLAPRVPSSVGRAPASWAVGPGFEFQGTHQIPAH